MSKNLQALHDFQKRALSTGKKANKIDPEGQQPSYPKNNKLLRVFSVFTFESPPSDIFLIPHNTKYSQTAIGCMDLNPQLNIKMKSPRDQ